MLDYLSLSIKSRFSSSVLLLVLCCLALSCASTQELFETVINDGVQPNEGARSYALYLVGDAGAVYTDTTFSTMPLLKRMLDAEGPNSAVVFLGDNIYPSGMPDPESPDRAKSEYLIDQQLNSVTGHNGQVVFVPGNHDWGGRGLGGDRDAVRYQEEYVEKVLDKGNTFLPDNGYPGPVEVALDDEITLVVLDTQWWLEDEKPFGNTGTYELDQVAQVLQELEDVLLRNEGKQIVVVGHHPILSNGEHGGFFKRSVSPEAIVRRFMGTPQDFSNLGYRRLRKALFDSFEEHPGLIYGSGHDHSLQYLQRKEQHYIVSGAASKRGYAAQSGLARFAEGRHGFARLMFYTDGSVWLEFWSPVRANGEGERIYATQLEPGTRPLTTYTLPRTVEGDLIVPEETMVVTRQPTTQPSGETIEEELTLEFARELDTSVQPYLFVDQGTVTVKAGDYSIPGIMKGLLGERYRAIWESSVDVPVIDLENTAGGLTPIKKGGGFQTTSLRMKGEDGDQYVLRSINKDASAVLPNYLRDTLVDDYVEDQTSAMHPFGAFVIPPLADAVGIHHTEPTLVMIPDDERLGIYREEMAGTLALFETRPNNEQRDEGRFGRPEDIISSTRLFEKIVERNEHFVDAHFFARSRLFDMFIGDWDRHQDQWRWAVFEPYEVMPDLEGPERKRGKVYRPIPRDRDFVFFKPGGLISDIAQAIGGPRLRLTKFGPKIKHLKGLNLSASNLDKQFLASLDKENWIAIAEEVQANLTDEVIEQAIGTLPESAFQVSGTSIIENLKLRRDQLRAVAEDYYLMLADKVEVVGSNENEEFWVRRLDDERTEVRVYKLSAIGVPERELFRRIFVSSETREIHLYGLNGVDRFVFDGMGGNKIIVRAVGGYGIDTYTDSGIASNRTVVYDTPGANTLNIQRATSVRLNTDPKANIYTSRRFGRGPVLPAFGYRLNSEDGLFLGTGLSITNKGFLQTPYRSKHTLLYRQSLFTRAYILSYDGLYPSLAGRWGGAIHANFLDNNNIRNFYGLGNESDGSEENRQRFRALYSQFTLEATLSRRFTFFRAVDLTARLEYTNLNPLPEGPFPGTDDTGFLVRDFQDKMFFGIRAAFNVDGTDTLTVTRSGARWLNSISFHQGIYNTDKRFLTLSSEFSYFYPIVASGDLAFAFRVGANRHYGEFEFYQANFISGRRTVRGYVKNRFAGHSNFYNNYELRARLFDVNAYVVTSEVGVLGFFDHGRVWAEGEQSQRWHAGYGGGLWVIPFGGIVINATYGASREGPLLDFFLRFLF